MTLEKPRHGTVGYLQLTLLIKSHDDLRQRQIRLALHQCQQPFRMGLKRRILCFLARPFGEAARFLKALEPFDRRGFRNHQLSRRSSARHSALNQRNRTLTQIKGMTSRHSAPPNHLEAQNRSFRKQKESQNPKTDSTQRGKALIVPPRSNARAGPPKRGT
jgi:hypothetical protein